jgi:hypothetical protein
MTNGFILAFVIGLMALGAWVYIIDILFPKE